MLTNYYMDNGLEQIGHLEPTSYISPITSREMFLDKTRAEIDNIKQNIKSVKFDFYKMSLFTLLF